MVRTVHVLFDCTGTPLNLRFAVVSSKTSRPYQSLLRYLYCPHLFVLAFSRERYVQHTSTVLVAAGVQRALRRDRARRSRNMSNDKDSSSGWGMGEWGTSNDWGMGDLDITSTLNSAMDVDLTSSINQMVEQANKVRGGSECVLSCSRFPPRAHVICPPEDHAPGVCYAKPGEKPPTSPSPVLRSCHACPRESPTSDFYHTTRLLSHLLHNNTLALTSTS